MELKAEREQITSSNNELYDYVKRIVAAVNYKGNSDHEDVPSILRKFAKGYEDKIKELTEENERLINDGFDISDYVVEKVRSTRADTVRKMQKRLKQFNTTPFGGQCEVIPLYAIDQIAKEMLEGE